MYSERTAHLLVGVLLALALFSMSAATVAGAPAAELEQATNETADATSNGTAANATVGNLTVWTAPGDDFTNLTTPAAVHAAMADGWLTRDRTVAEDDGLVSVPGDTVVFGLPAPGLVEAVAAADTGSSDTVAFVEVLNRSESYDFRMEQPDDTTTTMAAPKELNLSATLAADALRVVPDERNGTLYVALRTDRAALGRDGGYRLSLLDGEDYRVNLSATADDTTTSSVVEWEVVERSIDFDGVVDIEDEFDPIVARLGVRCTAVSGETSVAPGTEIQLVLHSAENGSFRTTARVTVDQSGQFATCLDTTGVARNATLRLGTATFDDDYNETVVDRQFESAAVSADIRSVWTAPTERFGDLTSPDAVDRGTRAGWLTRNRTVAVNDTVVFAVRAPELVDAIERTRGNDSTTERFVELVDRSAVYHFRMEQTEDTTLTEYDEKELNLSATLAAEGLRVVPDERNRTLYVAIRTDRAAFDRGSGHGLRLRAREAYAVTAPVTPGDTTASSTVRVSVAEPTVSFHTDAGGILRLGSGRRCAFVSGRVGSGESVSLDLLPVDSWGSLDQTRATADESGEFGACLNTTGIPGNTTLQIEADGYRGTARVILVPYEEWGSVTLSDQNAANGTITTSADLSSAGFLALYRAPSDETQDFAATAGRCGLPRIDDRVADRTPIGVSDHLEAGSTDDVPIELTTSLNESTRVVAVVHFDQDDDGQFDYPGVDVPPCFNGTVPADTATISPVGDPSTGSDGETGTVTAGRTTRTTRLPTTTAADGPGFGPAVALSALLAVALLARRRH